MADFGHLCFCPAADAVVISVPLGVLKKEVIAFQPPLPQRKQTAIRQLGFGVLNKVCPRPASHSSTAAIRHHHPEGLIVNQADLSGSVAWPPLLYVSGYKPVDTCTTWSLPCPSRCFCSAVKQRRPALPATKQLPWPPLCTGHPAVSTCLLGRQCRHVWACGGEHHGAWRILSFLQLCSHLRWVNDVP